jgi:hypothetical protein
MLTALFGGLKAGQALAGQGTIDAYSRQLESVYARYLEHRIAYYRSERRWPGKPFWASRM